MQPTVDRLTTHPEANQSAGAWKEVTNVLIKFHKDWIIIVTSSVNITKQPYMEKCHAPCGHVFKRTSTISDLSPDIISTNILTKFHRHWTTNVTSSVITRKTGPPPGSHVFQQTRTIFKFIRDMFHEDWTINVTSRVLKRKTATTTGGHVFHSTETIFELVLHPVFQPTGTIFELVQDIIRPNVLTKFHEDWTINLTSTVKTALPPSGHVFLPTGTIFELVKDFIGTHVPTKFHDDWTKNVTSRVLTRKTATPPGTQFHEDWTINVNVDAARQTTHKRRSQKLTMSTLCSDITNKSQIIEEAYFSKHYKPKNVENNTLCKITHRALKEEE
ncbi:hypothetical protein DPMN_114288 [Dreissena polymorpha]|uniref:Uncharacterized protein n=1 Tax=Dreissena polymorpha TaxID=45954 RepID=A0A9D4KJ43_DREPO|nr:hypothetical protein DPMN_114288 [Dreissena polymorpha]